MVEAADTDIVAVAEGALVPEQVLGDDEQRDAADPGGSPLDLGEHQMDDIVGQLVIAGGNPHLRTEQPVRPVGVRHRPGGDVG